MPTLSAAQLKRYAQDGYLVLRGAIDEEAISRLERGVANNPPLDGTLDPNAPTYPDPGRYTLANQCAKDPDLAFIIEHPAITAPVVQILGENPKLTAYVIYDRTPEGPGLPAHHDYKRWRPVGSSMNWLFTIVPFCAFDEASGPLYVAPGSHRLDRISAGTHCQEVGAAVRPEDGEFIDPQLERGDLLLMNMHLWHKASPNKSTHHRVGLFNKYAASDAPPATGYFVFDDAVVDALSPAGRNLIAVHTDLAERPIVATRALLVRPAREGHEVYLSQHHLLPGGAIDIERAIPDWDHGNYIAAAQAHLRREERIEVPWLSYVGDYPEPQGLCRLYAYDFNSNGFPVAYDGAWYPVTEAALRARGQGWIEDAVRRWLDPGITRGKGLSQAACRVDQFAY